MVDNVISTIDNALAKKGLTMKAVERWKEEMPREEEMRAKDKYTMFDRKEKRYRKGIHSKPFLKSDEIQGHPESSSAEDAMHYDN